MAEGAATAVARRQQKADDKTTPLVAVALVDQLHVIASVRIGGLFVVCLLAEDAGNGVFSASASRLRRVG